MDRDTELAMMDELLTLRQENSFFMQDDVSTAPVDRYASHERFALEQQHLFRTLPLVAAHSGELADPGDFVTRNLSNLPVLISRGSDGQARAFLNVCRHRGAELVGEASGCKRRFTCPYHAWTYATDGELVNGPHLAEGFPNIHKQDYNLARLPLYEKGGLIWVIADTDSNLDIAEFVEPLLPGLAWCEMEHLAPAISESLTIAANWKILAEGGLEAYHFKVAHRKTIGPHFLDNLSNFRMLGEHSVNVLAKNSMATLANLPRDTWRVREHSNVIFLVFPLDSFLLMEDHIAWINMRPVSAEETELRLTLLAPKDRLGEADKQHWQQNHAITKTTLMEDWVLNEGIQRGIASGANTHYTFGRFESALEAFNRQIESYLS